MKRTIKAKSDDAAPLPHYLKGDVAKIIKSYECLSLKTGRWWHYMVQFKIKRFQIMPNGRKRGLSSIVFLTKDQVM